MKPVETANSVWTDENIIIYSDGTWIPQPGMEDGWVSYPDSTVYASGRGQAHEMTSWGHRKNTHIRRGSVEYQAVDLAKAALAAGATP